MWTYILQQTSQSPWRLAAFGTLTTVALFVVGDTFSGAMMKEERAQLSPQKRANRSADDERTAKGRAEWLSAMIRDISDGRGDQHWNAAMKGTLVAPPTVENKTQGTDNELLARLNANASSSRKQ